MKKLILSTIGLLLLVSAGAQDFNMRLNVTSCSTFTVQIQCVDNSFLPTTGHTIDAMDFNIISENSFTLSVGSSFNGFNIATGGIATENGYNVATWAEQVGGNFTTNFVLNTWYDVASFTITSGSTNLLISTTAETPTFGSYLFTPLYTSGDELGRSTNNGTLAKIWQGGSTVWTTGSNWCPASAPSTGENIIIPNQTNDPSLSANSSLGTIQIDTGAVLNLNGTTLTARGVTGSGLIRGSSTSSLVLNGTAASTLNMDQTTPGSTNVLNNLTVNNSGGLTIGDDLEIIGVLTPSAGTIASGGNLIIAATGTTVYGQIAGTGSGTISGNVVMEKFLNNTNQGWRHLSIPLVGTLSGFGSIELQYTSPQNVMFWDASDAGGGTAAGWANGTSSSSRSLGGFTIYSDNALGFDITQTINYTGTYSKSDLGFAVKATEDPNGNGAAATGWNLIGNPFPSNLDLTAMFADWANNGNLTYQGIHIWDAVNEQYMAIMGSGVFTDYNTDGDTDNTVEILAPFQAFWVKANADVTFTVENGYRTTSNTNRGTFLKKDFDLARLKVLDPNGKVDQTVIYFHESATNNFDGAYDGYKLISMSSDVPSLYSVSPEGIFSINGLNSDNYSHIVPLGFRSNQTGQMTFSLNLDQLDAKWFVYLEDKELGIFYNIKDKPYTFNHTKNGDDRFVLHFQTYGLSSEKLVEDVKQMKIGGDGNAIYVFVPAYHKDQNYQLEIIDMAGRVVYTDMKLSLHHGMNTLNLNLNSTAYYAVRIKAAEGIASGKIQLR